MKKLLVLSLAVVMVVAFTLPASAFESVFGGYWRTRAFLQENFNGNDDIDGSLGDTGVARVDTRTRLYYTAILNDNLKLGVFVDAALFESRDRATDVAQIMGAVGAGPSIHLLLFDAFQADFAYAFGLDSSGYFQHGFSGSLRKAF